MKDCEANALAITQAKVIFDGSSNTNIMGNYARIREWILQAAHL